MELREESKKFLYQYFQKNMELSQQEITEILNIRRPVQRILSQAVAPVCEIENK